MRKHRGMSLIELMMAFAVLGILVVFVGGAMTTSYKLSASMQKIPSMFFDGQQQVESELESLNGKIKEKYLCEKELESGPNQEIQNRIGELEGELNGGYETVTLDNFFGQTVTVYQFVKECETEGVGNFTLVSGSAGGVRFERPVPVISDVTAKPLNESKKTNLYNPVGKTISTQVTYSDINKDYQYEELYQWFVSTGKQHAVYYTDDNGNSYFGMNEQLMGNMMAIYPDDFTLIGSAKEETLTITEDYLGKFIFCRVTPLSINGKMGTPVMSNMIYLSDLPTGYSYKMVFDASLTQCVEHESGHNIVTQLTSTDAANGSFIKENGAPYIDLNGAATVTVTENETGILTRFLRISPNDILKSDFYWKKNDRIIAVARAKDSHEASDFIVVLGNNGNINGARLGFSTNNGTISISDTGWYIIDMKVTSDGNNKKYAINGDAEIAELIIISNPGDRGISDITDYLKEKYS